MKDFVQVVRTLWRLLARKPVTLRITAQLEDPKQEEED